MQEWDKISTPKRQNKAKAFNKDPELNYTGFEVHNSATYFSPFSSSYSVYFQWAIHHKLCSKMILLLSFYISSLEWGRDSHTT